MKTFILTRLLCSSYLSVYFQRADGALALMDVTIYSSALMHGAGYGEETGFCGGFALPHPKHWKVPYTLQASSIESPYSPATVKV